jgi:hypothetical protein
MPKSMAQYFKYVRYKATSVPQVALSCISSMFHTFQTHSNLDDFEVMIL